MAATGIAPPTYPLDRPKYYAMRVVRLLVKSAAANEIGADTAMLITVIAATEDSRWYKSPVTFFNEQLMPLIGVSQWRTFDKIRNQAVASGWLVYVPSAQGSKGPGKYWTTIPIEHESRPDSPADEGDTTAGEAYAKGYRDGFAAGVIMQNAHSEAPNDMHNEVHSEAPNDMQRDMHNIHTLTLDPIPSPKKETLPAKSFEPETRNKRHPMAEYLPTPDAAIHGIEDADGFVMYQDDPERWERALIRWWNERPGVVLWPHDGLDDHARRLLYERMLDPKWTWKRTIGEFPLHFPSDWKASLDWFLEVGNVTKIIGKRFKATKPKGGQNGKTRDNTGATFSGTPDGGVGWGDGAANSQTGVF